jgi:succinate dehydrogenase/fumarate reductase flavoprotein subunit
VRHFETEVLIVGTGGAGMYAALGARRAGAERVLLLDKSLVGRGGATVMAQMTVAAALAEESPDQWEWHLDDTIASGRGLCDEGLSAILCREAPQRIREMDGWRVGWARRANGRIAQVTAPGHSRPRCCYVDFLATGTAVAATLRRRVARDSAIRRIDNLIVTDLLVAEGACVGAVGFDLVAGAPVTIAAGSVVLATGGLTRIFSRSSASANMGGDGYALALSAGAELRDMEFVQFFPIGHLAPRLVGMDPILWDPFRYKLGGKLLNGAGEEFLDAYGSDESRGYTTPRDLLTDAILKEVAAGRGSPHGGVYLSFAHVAPERLREAFGPIIARLEENGIDLEERPIEVAPIAHYHMGGVRVDPQMESSLPGLFAAGEAAGGANGANRLSGNAIPEALVFGDRAGRSAAERARRHGIAWRSQIACEALDRLRRAAAGRKGATPALALTEELRALMGTAVGPLRNESGLLAAIARVGEMRRALPEVAIAEGIRFNPTLADWFELRGSLLAAEAVARAALARKESRGAHQREDFPESDPSLARAQFVTMDGGGEIRTRFAA